MVLAAGAGLRFGGDKMLAEFRGRPLVTWAVQAALDTEADHVVVVHRVGDLKLEAALASAFAPALLAGRLALTACPDAAEGLGASLRHGVGVCAPEAEGVFVFLGDMPLIPPDIAPALARALRAGASAARPIWRGRPGHPVLFAAELKPKLLEARGDAGMRQLLADLGRKLVMIEAGGDKVLRDIDTPDDCASADHPA